MTPLPGVTRAAFAVKCLEVGAFQIQFITDHVQFDNDHFWSQKDCISGYMNGQRVGLMVAYGVSYPDVWK